MSSRAWISPSGFSTAFLTKAWQERTSLTFYERRGFGQFFYLTICQHLEHVLSTQIKMRLEFMRNILADDRLPPIKFVDGETTHECPVTPLCESLRVLTSSTIGDCETAPLRKLVDIHRSVFPQKLSEIIGKELNRDLDALAALRNLFAHGRDLFMDFDDHEIRKGTPDGNPLKLPAQVLCAAGIIDSSNITGQNWQDFHDTFYSDKALLYFHTSVKNIEQRLREFHPFLPEVKLPMLAKFPEIEA